METRKTCVSTTIFFCRQIDPDENTNRRALEKEYGGAIHFFPMPCSGRIEALHLLKAVEAGAEKVYLVTCPEGECRYCEGNVRAKKRLAYAQGLLKEVGLPAERLEAVRAAGPLPVSIDVLARSLLGLPKSAE